jgi:hypothetical protein
MTSTTMPTADELRGVAHRAVGRCGVDDALLTGARMSRTPVLGVPLLPVAWSTPADVDRAVTAAHEAFAEPVSV